MHRPSFLQGRDDVVQIIASFFKETLHITLYFSLSPTKSQVLLNCPFILYLFFIYHDISFNVFAPYLFVLFIHCSKACPYIMEYVAIKFDTKTN